ncbi:MAG: hypothetical protein HLX51_13555 [Micrococcaceae bacterium]|nr:hypothetical protein [Micrococcaceae bacterium]
MKRNSRNVMALSASLSLVALTGCSGLMGGENVESAPALSEIDDLMWESMEEAGNVTITADMSALSEDEPQLAQIFELMGGGDLSETRIYGALDASASAMSLSDDDLYRSFGDNDENSTYMSADALFNMLEDQSLGISAEEQ